MDKKDVWSTADIIENRNNWTLASDAELLKLLKTLSEKIFDKSRSTLCLLNSLENEVNRTCTSVANVNNRFRALCDTQFIESKVQDDTSEMEGPSTFETKTEETPSNDDITAKLKHALDNGIQILRTQYDIIPVTDSDTDDEEIQEVLLKSRNPYMRRRLPYIIGSEDFTKYDHVGLVSSSEDEDHESESEVEVDNIPRSKTEVMTPQPVKIGFSKQRTEVIRISSDSEDSEDSRAREKINSSEIPQTQPTYPTNSFASHLNETLKNNNVISVPIPSIVDEIFSPPPFPTQNTNDLSEAEDENSDNSSGDIFSSKKFSSSERVQSQTTNTIGEKIDNDESAQSAPSNSQYKKSLDSAIINPDSLPQKLVNTLDNHLPQLPSKPNVKMSGNKLFNAMHAELNAKLQKKNNPPNGDKSSIEDSNSDSNSKEINDSNPAPGSKNYAMPSSSSYKSQITPKLMPTNAKLDNSQPMITSSDIVKPKLTPKVAIPSLFDDDDSIDELFNSKETFEGTPGFEEPSRKFDQIFFDDVKTEDIVETRKKEKQSVVIPQYMNSVPALLNRKLDFFNEDSESDDDIFFIINSQKKKTPVADISNTDFGSSENEKETSSKNNLKSNLFESDEKKPITKPNVSELENQLIRSHSKDIPLEPEKKHSLIDKNSNDDDTFNFCYEKVSESYSKEYISNPTSIAVPRTNAQDAKKKNLSPTNKNSKEVTSFKESAPLSKYDLFTSCDNEIFSKNGLGNVKVDSSSKLVDESDALKPNKSSDFLKGSSKNVNLEFEQNLFKKLDSPIVNSESSSTPLSKADFSRPQILETPGKDVDIPKFCKSDLVDLVNESSSLESKDQRNTVTSKKSFTASLESKNGSSRKNLLTGTNSAPRLPGRKLNIDVNTLLPGSKWSVSKQTKNTSPSADTTPEVDQIERRKSNPSNESNSLNNIMKKRAKVSTTRRPSSRRARVQRAAKSDLFVSNSNTSDEEPDNVYKTASESNSPDDNFKNLGSSVKSGNKGSKFKAVEEDVIKENETDYCLPRDQCLGNEDIFNSLSSPSDELTSADNSRNIAKVEKMKSNAPLLSQNENKDVLEKSGGFDNISSASKHETADHFNTILVSASASREPQGNDVENGTADYLNNNFFSVSASREPPAVKESDFKNLFNDSDDEDIFSDVFQRNKIEDDDDLDRNFETPREHSDSSRSFISLGDDLLNDFLAYPNTLYPSGISVDRRRSSNPSNLFSFTSDDQRNTENVPTLSKAPIEANNAGLTRKSFQTDFSSKNFKNSSDFPGTSHMGYGKESSQTLNAKMNDEGGGTSKSKLIVNSKINDSSTRDLFKVVGTESQNDFNNLFLKSSATKCVEESKILSGSSSVQSRRIQRNTSFTKSDMNVDSEKLSHSRYVKVETSSLFADDEDDDFFSQELVKPKPVQQSEKSAKSSILKLPIEAKHALGDHSVASGSQKTVQVKASGSNKSSMDMFGGDDELFATTKMPLIKGKRASISLFDDDEEDDNDLFGSKVVSRVGKSVDLNKHTRISLSSSSEKGRVVKLRSEAVARDPLTGKLV